MAKEPKATIEEAQAKAAAAAVQPELPAMATLDPAALETLQNTLVDYVNASNDTFKDQVSGLVTTVSSRLEAQDDMMRQLNTTLAKLDLQQKQFQASMYQPAQNAEQTEQMKRMQLAQRVFAGSFTGQQVLEVLAEYLKMLGVDDSQTDSSIILNLMFRRLQGQ